jgi:hypothetical protein
MLQPAAQPQQAAGSDTMSATHDMPAAWLLLLSTTLRSPRRPRPAPCHNDRVRVLQLHPRAAAMPAKNGRKGGSGKKRKAAQASGRKVGMARAAGQAEAQQTCQKKTAQETKANVGGGFE